jgi:hypothetical protein
LEKRVENSFSSNFLKLIRINFVLQNQEPSISVPHVPTWKQIININHKLKKLKQFQMTKLEKKNLIDQIIKISRDLK